MFTITQLQEEARLAEKARRKREMAGRDVADDPVTDATADAEGLPEECAKAYRQRGITEGPGEGSDPGTLLPESVDRGYLDAGHAAESPQADLPRTNPSPLPAWPRGVPYPVQMPGAPVAQGIPASAAAGLTMGSPSDRGR